jgi:pimeloyl-ACP methyl ester carboxylesterase
MPAEIMKSDPALGATWKDIPGVSGELHYGRSPRFHQQAQAQEWTAAWSEIAAPVLVLYGEYDWFEDVDAAQTVVRVVNRGGSNRATLKVIPRMDHHFSQFPTAESAFHEKGGTVNEEPAVREMLAWLRQIR